VLPGIKKEEEEQIQGVLKMLPTKKRMETKLARRMGLVGKRKKRSLKDRFLTMI